MLFTLVVICALQFCQVQSQLELELVDADFEIMNSEYFDEENSYLTINEESDGLNTLSMEIHIVKEIPAEAMAHLYFLGYSMGEYKSSVGVDIEDTICTIFHDPVILGPFLEVLGLTEEDCPVQPNVYGQQHYYPKMDHMPDIFPSGEYRVVCELTLDDEMLLKFNIYVSIG